MFVWLAVLRRPRVFLALFGCGASKAPVGTLRRTSGSRPSSVGVLCASKVAELVDSMSLGFKSKLMRSLFEQSIRTNEICT